MALQVWLPLNGNLNNQGIADVTVTNNGATINDNGKIGKCYSFDGNTSGITINSSSFLGNWGGNNPFSIALWLYNGEIAGSRAVIFGDYNYNQYIGELSFNIEINGGGTGTDCLRFFWRGNPDWGSTTAKIETGKWSHISITYSGSETKIYVNGVLKDTRVGILTTLSKTNDVFMLGRDVRSGDSTPLIGKMNDFRIYDHCLSQKEVSEIAKGLVLHYKLDDPYIEPTVNLGMTSINYSTYNYGQEYALSGWGGDAGTVTYYKSGGYNNGPYKVYHKTATGTGGVFRKTANDIVIEAGKTYTMSIYVKASRDYTDSNYSFNINGVTATDNNHYITASQAVHFTTEWTRIVRTFTAGASDAGKYGEMSIIYNDSVTDYYVYWSCFQIEEGDHATEFTPTYRINPGNLYYTKTDMNWNNSGIWYKASNNGTPAPTIDSDGNIVLYGYETTGNHQSYIAHSGNYINILPNTSYTLSVMTKPSSTTAVFRMYFYQRTDTGSVRMDSQAFTPTSAEVGTWVKRSITITTQANTTKMYAELNCYNNPANTTVTLQNNSIELRQDNIVNYIKDSSGYAFNSISGTYGLTINNNSKRYLRSTEVKTNGRIVYPYPWLQEFSYSLWFKRNRVSQSNREMLGTGWYGISMELNSNNTLTFRHYLNSSGTWDVISTTTFTSTTDWYHIVLTRNASGVSKIYVNGVLDKSGTNANTINYTSSTAELFTYSNTSYQFQGCLSDFRIYATALAESDILDLYKTSGMIDNLHNAEFFEFDEVNNGNSRELEPYPSIIRDGSGNHYAKIINGNYTMGYRVWWASDYIPISPSGKTYLYDIEYSNTANNHLYIGFEKYDANKQSGQNEECQYQVNTTSAANHVRVTGTINLSTANGNTAAFTRLRLLNNWDGGGDSSTRIGTVHYISLKEVNISVTLNDDIEAKKTGILEADEFIEGVDSSFGKNGNVVSKQLIEI